MRRSKRLLFVGLTVGTPVVLSVLISCLADPREDDVATSISKCDVNQLSADPSSPQASLRAYLTSTDLLLARATAVEAELRDACNAANADLKLPAGSDAISACRGIAARVEAVGAKNPAFPPQGAPQWAELRYAANCTANTKKLAECIQTCAAGPCDTSKCDPKDVSGTCMGECNGKCVTQGDDIDCKGSCVGQTADDVDGGTRTCNGECRGTCSGGSWSAECAGSCAANFAGKCAGTCTGMCDGQPINMLPDAGAMEGGAGDGGAEGGGGDGGEGGAPPPAGPPRPRENADGNCAGFCTGVCSKGADGYCNGAPCQTYRDAGAPLLAPFTGGFCPANCQPAPDGGTATCLSVLGTGASGKCNGTCTEKKTTCAGTCIGECKGTRTNIACGGKLGCSQNNECELACQAQALLATTCDTPKFIEAYSVSDPAFHDVLVKHGAKIGKALSEVQSLRDAFGFVGDRKSGDFTNIGLSGDLVRECVKQGATTVAAADVKLRALLAADPSIRKTYEQKK